MFEGKLRESQYVKLLVELENFKRDLGENEGIIVYKLNIESKIDRVVIGNKGGEPSNII